tara:strand:+ start:145 stop:285 length:141 start_codon:yes stop_codon:yes gene_type:complete
VLAVLLVLLVLSQLEALMVLIVPFLVEPLMAEAVGRMVNLVLLLQD